MPAKPKKPKVVLGPPSAIRQAQPRQQYRNIRGKLALIQRLGREAPAGELTNRTGRAQEQGIRNRRALNTMIPFLPPSTTADMPTRSKVVNPSKKRRYRI